MNILPDVPELIWTDLNQKIADNQRLLNTTALRGELSQVAGGLAGLPLAQLPSTNNTPGDLYYATDGCKPGEAVGHGTGCPVYWDGTQLAWLRVGDYASPSGPAGTILGVGSGGTGANLIATGGANQFVRQSGVGAAFTVAALTLADMPSGLAVSPLTTKGDLWTYSTVDTRLAVGANNTVLVADNTQATGNKWAAALTGLTIDNSVIGGTTPLAGTFTTLTDTVALVGPVIAPAADSTTAIKITKADKVTVVATIDTTNGRFGIGVTPSSLLHISGAGYKDVIVTGTGTIGAGATFNATGASGRQYTAFSTASGAAVGGGAFCIFDELASLYRFILNNGGKAQISEGGAAIGNYAALGGVIFDRIADQSSTHTDGATFDTLYSESIAASALGTNGDMVKAFYSGTWVGTTTATRRFRIQFGGVTFLDVTFTGASATTESWTIEVWLMRENATTIRGFVRFTGTPENSTLLGASTNYLRNTSFTLSNANSLVLAAVAGGTGAASGDITASIEKIEWKSAA